MCTLQSKVLVKVKQADVCGSAPSTGEHVPGRERPPPLGPCLLHPNGRSSGSHPGPAHPASLDHGACSLALHPLSPRTKGEAAEVLSVSEPCILSQNLCFLSWGLLRRQDSSLGERVRMSVWKGWVDGHLEMGTNIPPFPMTPCDPGLGSGQS